MCGLYGIVFSESLTRPRRTLARNLFCALATEAQSRGTNAAGFAHVLRNGQSVVHKQVGSAGAQIVSGAWDLPLLQLGRNTAALLGHTRAATHGANIQANAHPFKFAYGASPLVGMHNGVIFNHMLASPLKVPYDNDSANVFLALAKRQECEWPKLLDTLDGSFALVMQRGTRLYFARNEWSPCCYTLLDPEGFLIYASTPRIVQGALDAVYRMPSSQIRDVEPDKLHVLNLRGEAQYNLLLTPSYSPMAGWYGGYAS